MAGKSHSSRAFPLLSLFTAGFPFFPFSPIRILRIRP